jgi:multicomponent Na+:H+ antiporter subunit D
VKRILSFHVVSQIGYMLMGLGLFTVAGVAGAVLFLVHQIPVKTVMFLVGGLIEDDQGNSSLDRVGGLAARRPIIAVLFAIPALSLAGIPPFSGFVAKLSLIDAGINAGSVAIVVVALVASMFTLLSMSKIWLGVFWREPTPPSEPASSKASKRTMNGATMAAVAGTLAVVAFAGPLWNMSEEIARDLLDGQTYIDEVLGTDRGGEASP